MQLGDRGLHPPTPVGAATAPGKAALQVLQPCLFGSDSPGQVRSSPVDRAAETVTPRSTPTTSPVPGAGIGGGMAANARCQRPARSQVMRYDFAVGNGSGQPEPHPADLGHHAPRAHLRFSLTIAGRLGADDAESLVQPGFAPGRSPVGACVEVLDGLVEVPQRLLLDGLRPGPQPAERGPRLGQLPCTARRSPASAPLSRVHIDHCSSGHGLRTYRRGP